MKQIKLPTTLKPTQQETPRRSRIITIRELIDEMRETQMIANDCCENCGAGLPDGWEENELCPACE